MVFLYAISLSIKKTVAVGKGDLLQITYFALSFLLAAFIELKAKPFASIRRQRYPSKVDKRIVIVLFITAAIWFSANIDVVMLAISNPRMFYASTRIGGGFIYYVVIPIILLLYFIFITKIDYGKKAGFIKGLFLTLAAFFVLYIFGQKATMLTVMLLFLTTYYYKSEKKGINKKTIKLGLVFAVIMVLVFALYSSQQSISFDNVLIGMATYSDYLSNFNKLVDNMTEFKHGLLFLQDEFLSYIPRAFWSSKPTLYGSLTLGLQVPELRSATLALTGAPSFGPLGQTYGDFGVFCVPISLIKDLPFFILAKNFEEKLKRRYNFYDHFLFLTFVGALVFRITLTSIPLYQLAVIFLLIHFSRNNKREFRESVIGEHAYILPMSIRD